MKKVGKINGYLRYFLFFNFFFSFTQHLLLNALVLFNDEFKHYCCVLLHSHQFSV